jgi:hypothetical protein
MIKNMDNKKFLLICCFVSVSSFFVTIGLKADYSQINWVHETDDFLYLDANNDHLDGSWGNVYNTGRSSWNYADAPILISDKEWSDSNVDLISVDGTTWANNGWGNAFAWAELHDGNTTCNIISTLPDTNCSQADYAVIYFNESTYPTGNSNVAAGTVAHEFGHVVGLEHTKTWRNEASLMHKSGYIDRRQHPTDYDISELNTKY